MVERIIEADKSLLAEFRARKEEVAQKKSELEEQQRLIEAQRNSINERRAQIVAYRGDRQRLMAKLEEQKREHERQQDQLERDAENLRRKILAWEMQNKKGFFGTENSAGQCPAPHMLLRTLDGESTRFIKRGDSMTG